MKFSIVTPVLNGMPQIQRCIGSVRGQKEVVYEHIMQDGGSSDGTVAWLKNQVGLSVYTERDNGMYRAINRGWSRASGDILSWLNADEQYLPGTLRSVEEYFEANPDTDALFGDTIMVNSHGLPIAARREIPLRRIYVLNGFLYASSCALFFKRSLLERSLLKFDESYRCASDHDLVLRLLDEEVKFDHLGKYFSLFGIDGKNLSYSPAMRNEMRAIYSKYHALPFGVLRKSIMVGRYVERLFAGCYLKSFVNYSYALNEIPEYTSFQNIQLGFRFTYKRFLFHKSVRKDAFLTNGQQP